MAPMPMTNVDICNLGLRIIGCVVVARGACQCTTRLDDAAVEALVDGEINRFMSFEFVASEDIPTARPTP